MCDSVYLTESAVRVLIAQELIDEVIFDFDDIT
jgi:hypothetical protein